MSLAKTFTASSLRNVFTIAARDIRASFVTPVAYAAIAGFMFLSGFFFFALLYQFNAALDQAALVPTVNPNLNEYVVAPFYYTLQIVLVFLTPILTMRSIAEEKRNGTFELLLTSPIEIGEIVLGKFLALTVLCGVLLLSAFLYPLLLIKLADPEVMPVLIGFLGLFLFTLSFASIGLAVSAMTNSQTVAGLVSIVLLLVLYTIESQTWIQGAFAAVLRQASPMYHTEHFLKGLLLSSDVVYFLSLTALGMFIANRVLDVHRWR